MRTVESADDGPVGTERVLVAWPRVVELASPDLPGQIRLLTEGSQRRQSRTEAGAATTHETSSLIHLVQVRGPMPDRTRSWLDEPTLPRFDVVLSRGADGDRPTSGQGELRDVVVKAEHGAREWSFVSHLAHGSREIRIGPTVLPAELLGYDEPVDVELRLRNVDLPSEVVLSAVSVEAFADGRTGWLARW